MVSIDGDGDDELNYLNKDDGDGDVEEVMHGDDGEGDGDGDVQVVVVLFYSSHNHWYMINLLLMIMVTMKNMIQKKPKKMLNCSFPLLVFDLCCLRKEHLIDGKFLLLEEPHEFPMQIFLDHSFSIA